MDISSDSFHTKDSTDSFVRKLGTELKKRKQTWDKDLASQAFQQAIDKIDPLVKSQFKNRHDYCVQQLLKILKQKQNEEDQIPLLPLKRRKIQSEDKNSLEKQTCQLEMDEQFFLEVESKFNQVFFNCLNRGMTKNSASVLVESVNFLSQLVQNRFCEKNQKNQQLFKQFLRQIGQYIIMCENGKETQQTVRFIQKFEEFEKSQYVVRLYVFLTVYLAIIQQKQQQINDKILQILINSIFLTVNVDWDVACGIIFDEIFLVERLLDNSIIDENQTSLINIIIFELGQRSNSNVQTENQYFDILLCAKSVYKSRLDLNLNIHMMYLQLSNQVHVPQNFQKWVQHENEDVNLINKRGNQLTQYILENMKFEEIENISEQFRFSSQKSNIKQQEINKNNDKNSNQIEEKEMFFIDTDKSRQVDDVWNSVIKNTPYDDDDDDDDEDGVGGDMRNMHAYEKGDMRNMQGENENDHEGDDGTLEDLVDVIKEGDREGVDEFLGLNQ